MPQEKSKIPDVCSQSLSDRSITIGVQLLYVRVNTEMKNQINLRIRIRLDPNNAKLNTHLLGVSDESTCIFGRPRRDNGKSDN